MLGFGWSLGARLVAIVSVIVTAAASVVAIAAVRRPSRVRIVFDVARLVVAIVGVAVMMFAVGTSVGAMWIVLALVSGMGLGVLQGRSLHIEWRGASPVATRTTVGLATWSTGVVVMQLAGVLAHTGLLQIGQLVGWFGAGALAGMIAGRQGMVAASRPVPAALVLLTLAGGWMLVTIGSATSGEAASDPGQWSLVATETNPAGGEAPPAWQIELGPTSIHVVQGMGVDDGSGAEAQFSGSWPKPPTTLEPGATLAVPVTVTGEITGSRETQYYFAFDVILLVDGRWDGVAVGAAANCWETTVISNEFVCSEPRTVPGELSATVPSSGDTWSFSLSALNCGGACEVRSTYRFVASGEAGPVGAGSDAVDPTATPETVIEPDQAIAQAIAGMIIAIAIGLISANEAGILIGSVLDRTALAREEKPSRPVPDPLPPPSRTDLPPPSVTSSSPPALGGTGTEMRAAVPRTHEELMDAVRDKLNAKPADRTRTLPIDEYVAYIQEIERRFPEADPADVFRALHADEFGVDLDANMPVPWTWQRFVGGADGGYYREILSALNLDPRSTDPPITYVTPKWLIGPNGALIDMTHAYAGVRSDMNREGQPEFWRDFMRWTQTDGGDSWQEVMHAPRSSWEHGEFRWASEFAPPDQRAGNALGNWLADFYADPANRDVPASEALGRFFEDASRVF